MNSTLLRMRSSWFWKWCPDAAKDTLSTQIASGNGPDVVGPVGVGGSNAYFGQWLDMTPQIESSGYDTTQFNEALVEFYQTEEGQVGLPFAVFPPRSSTRRPCLTRPV